jgi:outer membrane protein TolC
MGNASETLRSAQVGRPAAQEALRVANVRFRTGVGTQLEVVTVVQNAATADSSDIQVTLNYDIAVAQLDLAIGVQVQF